MYLDNYYYNHIWKSHMNISLLETKIIHLFMALVERHNEFNCASILPVPKRYSVNYLDYQHLLVVAAQLHVLNPEFFGVKCLL